MKRQDILNTISKIEEELPVYDWRYNDIDIWPLCKWFLFIELSFLDNSTPELPSEKMPNKKIFLTQRITAIRHYLKGFRQLIWFNRLKRKEAIFLGASSHRVDFNGHFINRYYEPLKDKFSSYLNIELNILHNKKYIESSMIDLSKYHPLLNLVKKFTKTKENIEIHAFEKIADYFDNIDIIKLKNRLLDNARDVEKYAVLFELMLKRTNPKEVYSLCYYSSINHALHHTANKLNIINYDIQHGGQGPLHPMYTYSNLPNDRQINTLPQRFWVWDDASFNHIKSWLPQNNKHTVENKGNPWWQFAIDNTNAQPMDKKIILYTLQFATLDQYIIDAIDKTPNDFVWYLRLHPRKLESKSQIESQLEKRNLLDKVNFDDATSLPLPYLLKICHIHISKYSGSLIEAEAMGKKSIILEEIGINNYKDIIEKGNAIGIIEPTGNNLLNAIIYGNL